MTELVLPNGVMPALPYIPTRQSSCAERAARLRSPCLEGFTELQCWESIGTEIQPRPLALSVYPQMLSNVVFLVRERLEP